MSLSLARLTAPTVRRALEWEGERIEFTFRPGAHTAAFESRMIDATRENDPVAIAGCMAELVTWIDVVDDTGTHITCDRDTFAALLPATFLQALWAAVSEAARPDPPKGGTSAAG